MYRKWWRSKRLPEVRRLPILFLCVLFTLFPYFSHAQDVTEARKIHYLIEVVKTSGHIFIRNGTEYNSDEAARHLEKKWGRVKDKITTADDFITYIASKSSMSGEPYLIKLKDGKIVASESWLKERLKAAP